MLLEMVLEWNRNWREAFLSGLNGCSHAAWGGSVRFDRDALYGSKQRRLATVVPFSRHRPESTARITSEVSHELA